MLHGGWREDLTTYADAYSGGDIRRDVVDEQHRPGLEVQRIEDQREISRIRLRAAHLARKEQPLEQVAVVHDVAHVLRAVGLLVGRQVARHARRSHRHDQRGDRRIDLNSGPRAQDVLDRTGALPAGDDLAHGRHEIAAVVAGPLYT